MTDEDEFAKRDRRLADVIRRRNEHPGYREHQLLHAMARTLTEVFQPNAHELLRLLERAATDQELAFELIQNVHEDSVRRQFHAATSQRLHNYLASTMSLVEHARRLMRGRSGEIADNHERRLNALRMHDEVPFMIDLRVFTQHRTLPVLGHTLKIGNPNSPDAEWHSEVELSVHQLLEWDRWAAQSRRFVEAQGGSLTLRPVVQHHAQLVFSFNAWLYDTLAEANESALAELNELTVEANAVMLGCSIDEAREYTDRRERERRMTKEEVSTIHGPAPAHDDPNEITARLL